MRRNYGLVLPKNYVSIEKDEIEYIGGGIKIDNKWYGVKITLSGIETSYFLDGYDIFTSIIGGVMGWFSAPLGVALGFVGLVRSKQITRYNSDNSGICITFTWAHISLAAHSPWAAATAAIIKDRG